MDAATIVFYGNRTFLSSLDGLDTSHWNTPGVCGVWSVQDIISHLAVSEVLLGDVLGMFCGETEKPMFDLYTATYQTWNDDTVAARKHLSAQQALEEYQTAHEEVMRRVKLVAPEVLARAGTIPWYGEGYSLDDYIVYGNYGHKREHAAQIMVFQDSLK